MSPEPPRELRALSQVPWPKIANMSTVTNLAAGVFGSASCFTLYYVRLMPDIPHLFNNFLIYAIFKSQNP